MAAEWREAFVGLGRGRGFEVRPLLTFAATGANGADLPVSGTMGGRRWRWTRPAPGAQPGTLPDGVLRHRRARRLLPEKEDFRAASLPGLERRMEQSALSADYGEVARRCGSWTRSSRAPTGWRCASPPASAAASTCGGGGRGGRRLPAPRQEGRPDHQPALGRDIHRALRRRAGRRPSRNRGPAGGDGRELVLPLVGANRIHKSTAAARAEACAPSSPPTQRAPTSRRSPSAATTGRWSPATCSRTRRPDSTGHTAARTTWEERWG